MSAYCTTQDAYAWIPRGSIGNSARGVSATASSDILTCSGHGLATNDEVTFRADAGGSLPSPLVAATTYYAIALTDSTFKVAATSGGAAIDLTTAGSNALVIVQAPWDRWIEEESALVECQCPPHVVPFETTPAIVRRLTSMLVASRALTWGGKSTETVQDEIDTVWRLFADWKKGQAIRGTVEPDNAQVPQLYTWTSTQSTRTIP